MLFKGCISDYVTWLGFLMMGPYLMSNFDARISHFLFIASPSSLLQSHARLFHQSQSIPLPMFTQGFDCLPPSNNHGIILRQMCPWRATIGYLHRLAVRDQPSESSQALSTICQKCAIIVFSCTWVTGFYSSAWDSLDLTLFSTRVAQGTQGLIKITYLDSCN